MSVAYDVIFSVIAGLPTEPAAKPQHT